MTRENDVWNCEGCGKEQGRHDQYFNGNCGECHDDKLTELVDEVTDSLLKDIALGDLSILDELLRKLPIKILIESLDENNWKKYKDFLIC